MLKIKGAQQLNEAKEHC